jgi:flagellar protein FliS
MLQDNSPIMKYQEQAVNTMSRGELVVKLFDEALKQATYASMLLKNKDYVNSDKCIDKCKDIFTYLTSVLDRQYEISNNLYEIYYFIRQELIKANIKRDPAFVEEVIPLISEMRDTWAEAEKRVHMQK